MPEIKSFKAGDILKMKKKHPCGCFEMKVIVPGSDVKIQCAGCGHSFVIPRIKLEKSIKSIIPLSTDSSETAYEKQKTDNS